MKVITKRRYSSFIAELLEIVGWYLTVPWKYAADNLLACFIPVTIELKKPWVLFVTFLVYLPLFSMASLVTIPFAVIGFAVILPIRHRRLPYLYSYLQNSKAFTPTVKKRYKVATANLCLLPEYISRVNNLNNTYQRTKFIAQKIIQDQFASRNNLLCHDPCHGIDPAIRPPPFPSNSKIAQPGTPVEGVTKDFSAQVLEKFPEVDILLLQETWYKSLSDQLATHLHQEFPWIVYDASYDSFESNLHVHNSGVMIASRYEIEEVAFNWFRDSCNYCKFNSKGLLQIKVRLGQDNGVQKVGYAAVTHLQVFQGKEPVHLRQLDVMNKWSDEFREKTQKSDEQVAFDVIGGDFNFDNLSPVDVESANHIIFEKYVDVGRTKAGQDHYWAVGTECRPRLLHDPLVSTPHGLKLALEDPILLQNYILNAEWTTSSMELVYSLPERDDQGNIIPSPVGGRRRIDFLLHRKEDQTLVSSYNPVTSLAALTDHIPLCFTVETK